MNRYIIIIGLGLSLGFLSCASDDTTTDLEDQLKSYELMSVEWKLDDNDNQIIIEHKLPEYHFRNDSDTVIEVKVDPLEHLGGISQFSFNDSLKFKEINAPEVQVTIPDELSLLSDTYSFLYGGITVPISIQAYVFPFKNNFTTTYLLPVKAH